MATQTRPTPPQKNNKPAAPKHLHRHDETHLESLDQLGLIRDESDQKTPVEALFTHENDSVNAHKPIM